MTNTTKQTKIVVTNQLGTINRTTARPYAFVVMCVTNENVWHGERHAGSILWTSKEDAAHKAFDKSTWRVTREGGDFDTLAVCKIDGTIIRRIDRPAI